MTVHATPGGYLVTLPYGLGLARWGPYPTAADAEAVEQRLLRQLAREAAADLDAPPPRGQFPLLEAE